VDPPEELTRVNGKKSLVVAISMVEDGNIVQLGRLVKERLDSLVAELPIGLDFEIVAFQPAFVERSVKEFMVNLGEAFFFVVIVMLLFAGLRMGLIAGLLVPMAMLMCVTLMPAFGVKLQQVSIAALIISLGILVDNGVVVSENILVRLAAGQERVKAARGAVSELSKPLLMASLTTIFAFLPIATADSAVGEYTLSLFIVVTLTLLSSWLLAMTMIPLLCYTFLKPRKKEQTFSNRFYHVYRRFLLAVLKNRLVFIILVLLALFGGFRLFQMVPTVFFPPNDREQFTIDFWQPYGSDIRTTAGRVAALEEFLLNYTTGKEGNENQPVESVASFVGYGGPRWYLALDPEQSNPSYCFMLVNVHQYKGMHEVIRGTRQYLNERFPDTRHSISPLENGPPVGAPIQIRIKGNNIDKIYKVRDRIAGEISSITGVLNIRDNWGEWTKKLIVDVNQDQAKFAGFTSRDIALSLQSQVSGMTATQYREGEDIIPIVLRSKEAYRESLGRIETLNVYSYLNGASVPLLRVADTRLVWQPSNIRRRNEIRTLTLKTDVKGRYPSEVLADIIPLVEKLKESDFWPRGYAVEYGGEFEKSREANQSIIAGLPLAFGLILLVLVYQFNSIRRPMIIALSIPPMIIGISIGLLLTNAPFGFMAMLGMISLTGIIVNNAIMLIDRVEIEKERGQNPPDAVVIASQRRLRPILMTTLTTMVGLIPLSIQGGEMWRPMANTLIFGLAFATILTLGLCPVLYSVLFRIGFKGYSWDSGVLNRSDD
jgi:multidrug efflux pump subunit AcrB